MTPSTTRVALALAAGAALALPAASDASARPRRDHPAQVQVAPGVTIDGSRLRALGLGPTADLVERTVAAELGQGGIPGRAGGRVVVRLTGLSLPSYAGPDGGGGGGGQGGGGGGSGGNFDYLSGDLLVVGPAGEVVAQRPLVVSSTSSSGGAYYLPGFDQRRIIVLSRNFAEWVRRSL